MAKKFQFRQTVLQNGQQTFPGLEHNFSKRIFSPGRNPARLSKSDIKKNIFRTGPQPVLLARAVNKGRYLDTLADIQRADSLWRIQFVSGQGQEVSFYIVNINVDFAGALRGIGVKENSRIPGYFSNSLHRLYHACFVVGMHHGNECRPLM